MRKLFCAVSLAVLALVVASAANGQDAPKPSDARTVNAIKVTMVLTEFDGKQKVSSLPYTTTALPPTTGHGVAWSKTRIGARIPIATGAEAGKSEYQYLDIGTDLDCGASLTENGQFHIQIQVDRSSAAGRPRDESKSEGHDWRPGDPNPSTLPIVYSSKMTFDAVMRDGQSLEGATSTDPLTGHVWKIEVTLEVVK